MVGHLRSLPYEVLLDRPVIHTSYPQGVNGSTAPRERCRVTGQRSETLVRPGAIRKLIPRKFRPSRRVGSTASESARFAQSRPGRVILAGRYQRPIACAHSGRIGSRTLCKPSKTAKLNGEHFREQAHFPAEQPASQPHPWLPPPHAHPRRARHHLGPPQPGPRPPRRLTNARRAVRCWPRPRGFAPPRISAPPCAGASVVDVPAWCCTWCAPISRRPERASWCRKRSVTPSGATG